MKKILQYTIICAAYYGVSVQIGLWNGKFTGQQLLYYTILSNIIVGSFYIIIQFYSRFEKNKYFLSGNIQGAITLMILITGLVYHIVLHPQESNLTSYSIDKFSNFLLHTYVPLAVFIDWIVFVHVRNVQKLKPLYWLIIPLGYWILAIVYASFEIPFILTDSYYAYSFIDIDRLGFNKVIFNALLCSVLFFFIGYLLKLIQYVRQRILSSTIKQ